MKLTKSIIVMSLIFCFSCKEKASDKMVTISEITSNYDSLTTRVKLKGDIDAYDELFYNFMDSNQAGRTDSVMYYSKIMANKFKYEKAYFDYLDALLRKNHIPIDYNRFFSVDIRKMNDSSKQEAITWLDEMLKNKVITKDEYDEVKK